MFSKENLLIFIQEVFRVNKKYEQSFIDGEEKDMLLSVLVDNFYNKIQGGK